LARRPTATRASACRFRIGIGDETKTREISSGSVKDEFFWRVKRGGTHELELTVRGLPENGEIELKGLKFEYQGGALK
jgi:hypothetical protein